MKFMRTFRNPSSDVNNDQLRALVGTNSHLTVLDFAEELGVAIGKVMNRLQGYEKSKKVDNWVPLEMSGNKKYFLGSLFYAKTKTRFSTGL